MEIEFNFSVILMKIHLQTLTDKLIEDLDYFEPNHITYSKHILYLSTI
jgi:hypothetical protein